MVHTTFHFLCHSASPLHLLELDSGIIYFLQVNLLCAGRFLHFRTAIHSLQRSLIPNHHDTPNSICSSTLVELARATEPFSSRVHNLDQR